MGTITTKRFIKFKKSEIKFPVLKIIKKRFSPRLFSPEKIKEKELNSILEAARWAPSAYNFQPWKFYLAQKESEAYEHIFSNLSEVNKSWADSTQVFIVACYLKERNGEINKFREYDLGAAVMSLVFQAQSLGIYARQMGLFDSEKIQNIFNISAEEKPFTVIALGKIGNYSKINPELFKKEDQKRERKIDFAKKL
jgi:nitroreductase